MSENSVKRTVLVGSMAYVDPDGRTRRADCGAEVLVHPGSVARFDRLNVLPGETPADAEPRGVVSADSPVRHRGRPRKDATD